ncbi:DUF5602 domain-containing protein [Rhodococcus phenolicus]|uniref:DUF5602 domain-containing protein n=1 Tax=Rhodococcus phenolicus TaxID=263849 RepID=UPI00082AD420|nr:DUF5602 domain-containing protein [Rhodococcus phenolicus]
MGHHRLFRSAGLAVAAFVVASGPVWHNATAAPDESRTHFGSTVALGDGVARTFTSVDPGGNPTAVGIRLSAAALDGLSGEGTMLMLELPEAATATAFDHVMLNWNPRGHPPDTLFGKPHFDLHFYMTDMASIGRIDPAAPDYATRAANLPAAQYIPQGYILPPGPAAEQAVPFMGTHWLDATEGMIPGVYDFTETFINGSWDGNYTFMEPMITRAWLLTEPTLQEEIKQPSAYQRSAYYPTVYTVRFDDRTQEFEVALSEMVFRGES